jgi:hypothetical protein
VLDQVPVDGSPTTATEVIFVAVSPALFDTVK